MNMEETAASAGETAEETAAEDVQTSGTNELVGEAIQSMKADPAEEAPEEEVTEAENPEEYNME